MIKKISTDKEFIFIQTNNNEVKYDFNSINKIYIHKENDFWINLGITLIIAVSFLMINYFYFNNIFLLNLLIILLLFLILKEFVFKFKTKYYIVFETEDFVKHEYRFKSYLKYDIFHIKDQFYLYKQLYAQTI